MLRCTDGRVFGFHEASVGALVGGGPFLLVLFFSVSTVCPLSFSFEGLEEAVMPYWYNVFPHTHTIKTTSFERHVMSTNDIFTHTHTHTHAHTHTHTQTHTHTCTHTHTHAHTHTHTHMHTHTHTCTHTRHPITAVPVGAQNTIRKACHVHVVLSLSLSHTHSHYPMTAVPVVHGGRASPLAKGDRWVRINACIYIQLSINVCGRWVRKCMYICVYIYLSVCKCMWMEAG